MKLTKDDLIKALGTGLIALLLSYSIGIVYATWSPPTESAPNGDVPAPINVGTTTQWKDGGLVLNASSTVSTFGLITFEKTWLAGTTTISYSTSTISSNLTLGVDGNTGSTQYCDKNGGNCFTAASVSSLISGGGGSDSKTGYTVLSWGAGVTTQTIAHGLGRIPKKITLHCDSQIGNPDGTVSGFSIGTWTPTGQSYTAFVRTPTHWEGGTNKICYVTGGSRAADMVATVDATNIILTITLNNSFGSTAAVQWEAE